jgi:hypothetical protein
VHVELGNRARGIFYPWIAMRSQKSNTLANSSLQPTAEIAIMTPPRLKLKR